MKKRRLGTTGLAVSELGFGTWGLGGDAYGPADDQESRALLQEAVRQGITFFDSADLYGQGRSERVIGEAFQGMRERVVVASKTGFLDNQRQAFSPERVRETLEASLRRLRTDHIDLYQFHSPPMAVFEEQPALLEAMEDARRAGLIRAFGISTRTPDDALVAIRKYGFRCVQVNYNLLDQRARTNGLLALCREQDVGFIARTPLVFGYLTGKYSGSEALGENDHRAGWSAQQRVRWASAAQRFGELTGDARSLVHLALLFCLADPAVSTVIPGMMDPQQLHDNLRIQDMAPLTADEQRTVREIYQEYEATAAPRPTRTPR